MITTEGIVLKAHPYKEHDKILTLFTPEGQLSLYFKGGGKTPLSRLALATPLVKGEYICRTTRGELHQFCDGTLLDQHLALRERLSSLETAQKMAGALLKTQWPGKSAQRLYALFCALLAHIPLSSDPNALLCAFLLKILKSEGVLQLEPLCAACSAPLLETFRYLGELYCPRDAPPGALCFTETEERCIALLSHSRSLQEIGAAPCSARFTYAIEQLFSQTCPS